MSMNERNPAESSGTSGSASRRRWPFSLPNTILVLGLLLFGAVGLIAGRPSLGVPMLLGGLIGGAGTLLARRAGAGDLERVNAMEYADERERAAGMKGLAAVGAVALILWLVQLLGMLLLGGDYPLWEATLWGFIALCAVWFAANWFFVRRG